MGKISTYHKILEWLFRTEATENDTYNTSFKDGKYVRYKNGGKTARLPQEVIVTENGLLRKCTNAQRYIIGLIFDELKDYNALWYCDPELKSNGNYVKAIKGLLDMEVLIKTETTNIYLVNPFYIRKGDFHGVLATTAKILQDDPVVGLEHIKNKKPVKEITFYHGSQPDVGYGYESDEIAV